MSGSNVSAKRARFHCAAVGWFAYAPLSETPYSSQLGVDYWAIALLVLVLLILESFTNEVETNA